MSTDSKPAGYIYKADTYCDFAAAHNYIEDEPHLLVTHGTIDAVRAMDGDVFGVLLDIAAERGINPDDLESYDSDDFPKPFTKEEVGEEVFCPHCLVRFSDGAQLRPYTVLGLEMTGGKHLAGHILAGHLPEGMVAAAEEDDGYERWTARVTAPDQDSAVAKALAMAVDGVEESLL